MEGILPLWKEAGMTSHDCVFKLRKILKTKKIGHGGTLDPEVSGVLPICIGKGTKVIEYMVDSGKCYEGEITLGFSTATEDSAGEIVDTTFLEKPFSNEEIDQVMKHFQGTIKQVPPMFSAVKVNGRRLYDYARKGEAVQRPERKVEIHSFVRTSEPHYDETTGTQTWRFKVICGKGTYVRTLAVDTGRMLGVASHMSQLTRKSSGGLWEEQCVTLAQVQERMDLGGIEDVLLPIEVGIEHFKRVDISNMVYQKVKNGVFLSLEELCLTEATDELIALYHNDQVVSLYQMHPTKEGMLKPSKVLRIN